METADVGVIGAGIHGASAAFHLATRGASTTIIERGTPAGGPTGRSSGICRAYYTNPFLARMSRDSIRMFERFPEITNGGTAELQRTGMLFLHPPEDSYQVRAAVGRLKGLGIATDILEPGELASRFPEFELDGVGLAAFERDAGHADPAGATNALFRRALELGAEPRLGVEVTAIEPAPGGGAAIATSDGGAIVCSRVLIAAGPWTRALARTVGVDLPLTVERHVVASFEWGGAEPVQAHGDLVLGYYMRPEGEALCLVGPLHPAPQADPNHFSHEISHDEIEHLARLIVRRVPRLERSNVHGGWASLYDVSPDWQPVIGEIAPGIFVDAGTSGHGFKLAPALGREVAAMVLGEQTDPGLAEFSPARFEEGRRLDAGYREARILG